MTDRAARELDAVGDALVAIDDDAGDDDHPRQDDRVPPPAEEVEVGVFEDMHIRLSAIGYQL